MPDHDAMRRSVFLRRFDEIRQVPAATESDAGRGRSLSARASPPSSDDSTAAAAAPVVVPTVVVEEVGTGESRRSPASVVGSRSPSRSVSPDPASPASASAWSGSVVAASVGAAAIVTATATVIPDLLPTDVAVPSGIARSGLHDALPLPEIASSPPPPPTAIHELMNVPETDESEDDWEGGEGRAVMFDFWGRDDHRHVTSGESANGAGRGGEEDEEDESSEEDDWDECDEEDEEEDEISLFGHR